MLTSRGVFLALTLVIGPGRIGGQIVQPLCAFYSCIFILCQQEICCFLPGFCLLRTVFFLAFFMPVNFTSDFRVCFMLGFFMGPYGSFLSAAC